MSEENPYQAPSSHVEPVTVTGDFGEPQSLSPGRGASWIASGWSLFKQSPMVWILMTIVFWVIVIIMSVVPFVSILVSILMPIFTAGFMLVCKEVDDENAIDVGQLFAGFKQRTGDLAALGAINLGIYFLLGIFIFIAMMTAGIAGGVLDMETGGDPFGSNPMLFMSAMMIPILIVALLILPIMMLFWFSPAIIVFNEDVGVIEAMKLSFMGCLKNILPLTIYSLVLIVLIVFATLPFMLGWLILSPVVYGSLYASYKDIYIRD